MENFQVRFIGFFIWLVVLPQLVMADCIFGPDNLALLESRNKIILGKLNYTLFNYTNNANTLIYNATKALGRPFKLWEYLTVNHSVTPGNYLDFVTMGGLQRIDWVKVLTVILGMKPTTTVSNIILTELVYLINIGLQSTASKYSFSLGMYRPHKPQFSFTGITESSKNGTFELDLSCQAGSNFIWLLSTNLTLGWNTGNQSDFPQIATAVEHAFELYYRNHSVLGPDFVRANILNCSEFPAPKNLSLGPTLVCLETYFKNSTYKLADIQSLTNLTTISPIEYTDTHNQSKIRVIINASTFHLVIPTSIHPSNVTNVTPTLGTNSSLNKTPVGINVTVAGSLSSLLPPMSVNTTTNGTSTRTPPTVDPMSSTTNLTPFPISIALLTSPSFPFNSNQSAVSSQTSIPPTFKETVPGLNQSNQTSTNFSLHPSNTGALGSNSSNQDSNSTQDMVTTVTLSTMSLTTVTNTSQIPIITLSSSSSFGETNFTTSVPNEINFNSTSQTKSPGNVTNTSATDAGKPQSTDAGSTRSFLENSTLPSPKDMGNSTGITGHSQGISSSTTFDPDPVFQAVVPVITKVYNDEFLLRRIGTMAPLTVKEMFYTITIPTSVAMIVVALLCMVCLQIDCLPSKKNKDKLLLLPS